LLRSVGQPAPAASHDAAVDAEHLTVHPAGGTGEKSYGLGDVLRDTEPLQWRLRGHAGDGLLVLAVEEESGGGRAGSYCVDGDVTAPELAGEDQNDALDPGLARDAGTV